MPLRSALFTGSARIKEAYENYGRRSLKISPPEEPDATRRLQKALLLIEGTQKVKEFFPYGANQEPNGVFGPGMVQAVMSYQQRVFPGQKGKHDGRVGKETLDVMDAELSTRQPNPRSENPQQHHGGVLLTPQDTLVYMSGVTDEPNQIGNAIFQKEDAKRLGDQALEFSRLQRGGTRSRFLGVRGSTVSNIGVDRVVASVVRDFEPASKLIMYGYSAGAKQLIEVCQRLEERNFTREKGEPVIKVDLLVTVDAVIPEFEISRAIPGCVRKNLNYFQRVPWSNLKGADNTAVASKVDGSVCKLENTDCSILANFLAGYDVAHGLDASPHGKMAGIGHGKAMPLIRAELGS